MSVDESAEDVLRKPKGAWKPEVGREEAKGERAGRHTTTGSSEPLNLRLPAGAGAAKLSCDISL
jgi:hypothetical protein